MPHPQSIALSRSEFFRSPFVWSVPALAICVLAAVALRLAIYGWLAQPAGLIEAMCQFDCGWYARLAMKGYGADSEWENFGSYPHWAFFPLYPLGVGGLHKLLGISALAAGMVFSSLCLGGFTVLGAIYLRETRRVLHPAGWLIVALLFPYGFFFSAVYTEALFAMLSVGTLLMLHRRQPLLASCLAALTSATRPTGVLLTPILVADRLTALWHGRHRPDRVALLAETLLPIAIAPLGLFLYMFDQYSRIGDAMAFSHVQVLWDRHWANPLGRIWAGLQTWDFSQLLAHPSSAYSASFALLGLAGATWLALRRRGAEAAFLVGCILLPAATGLDSLPRFVAANPVFLFVVYDLMTRLMRGRAHPVVLTAFAIVLAGLQIVLLNGWVHQAGAIF